jgi:DNA-binding response OmpR family regulator
MKNILIVDDDKDILAVLKILLTKSGFNVVATAKGEDTYAHLASPRPDVILLDINLLTVDGRDICKNIKGNSDTKDIPIVMFTANHNMRDHLGDCNANEFIEKPFEINHLVKTLKGLCK